MCSPPLVESPLRQPPPDDFAEMEDVFLDVAGRLISEGKAYAAVSFYEFGAKIERKRKTNRHEWNRHIANAYEKEGDGGEGSARFYYHMNALEHYRKIPEGKRTREDNEKIKELEREFVDLRSKQEFKKATATSETEKAFHNLLKTAASAMEAIMEGLSSEQILLKLAKDETFLPDPDKVRRNSEQISGAFPLLSLMPVTISDERGNRVKQYRTAEEKREHSFLSLYRFNLHSILFSLNTFFEKSARSGKLDADAFLKFLHKNSWLGKRYTGDRPATVRTAEFRPLDWLAPGIIEYFRQMEISFASGTPANFTLSSIRWLQKWKVCCVSF